MHKMIELKPKDIVVVSGGLTDAQAFAIRAVACLIAMLGVEHYIYCRRLSALPKKD